LPDADRKAKSPGEGARIITQSASPGRFLRIEHAKKKKRLPLFPAGADNTEL